jgi:hypothetical protein
VTDVKRLGKRGSYRLGQLRLQGTSASAPPALLRPSFNRPQHRGLTSWWLVAAVAGTALIAGGALIGLWFTPFAVGLLAGLANRIGGWRARVMMVAVSAMAIAGWGVPLWWPTLHGQPVGATARVIAALGHLPAYAFVGVAVTLLVAVLQALAGLWLGRALTPRPAIDVPGPVI